jgi:Lecithin retinol acyltransferase
MAKVVSRPRLEDQRLPVGCHIKVRRPLGYYHHGVYVGWGRVVHYSGLSSGLLDKGPIVRTRIDEFVGESKIEVVQYGFTLPKDVIIVNTEKRLHESDYRLFKNNCEHFATWCVTGNAHSKQVQAFIVGGLTWLLVRNLIEGYRA